MEAKPRQRNIYIGQSPVQADRKTGGQRSGARRCPVFASSGRLRLSFRANCPDHHSAEKRNAQPYRNLDGTQEKEPWEPSPEKTDHQAPYPSHPHHGAEKCHEDSNHELQFASFMGREAVSSDNPDKMASDYFTWPNPRPSPKQRPAPRTPRRETPHAGLPGTRNPGARGAGRWAYSGHP